MLRAILVGGVIAGFAFMIPAVLIHALAGLSPLAVPHLVASGVLGEAAYEGGWRSAWLGLILHMALSLGWAALWVALATRVEMLLRRPWLAGAGFGLVIWAVMTLIVMPLSRSVPDTLPGGTMMLGAALAHIVLVGWPIAWIATFLAPRSEDQPS